MAKESQRLAGQPQLTPPAELATMPAPAAHPSRSYWGDAWRRLRKDRAATISMVVIAIYVAVALGAAAYEDVLAPRMGWPTWEKMENYDESRINQPPRWPDSIGRWADILGTDWQGKSVLIKTIYGAKISLQVGLIANLIAVPLGMILGATAGYFGRISDRLIVWLYSTLASIPGIILLISIKYAFKDKSLLGLDLGGTVGLYLALGMLSWVGTCRLVRAEVMKVRELDYVTAARALGRREFPILLRHVLPNVLHIAIITFSLGFVAAVQSEVTLSYLNLGVGPETPSWGKMIDGARMDLIGAKRWWELTSAVVAMFFLVLALNIFGDRLRDALDPRLKNA